MECFTNLKLRALESAEGKTIPVLGMKLRRSLLKSIDVSKLAIKTHSEELYLLPSIHTHRLLASRDPVRYLHESQASSVGHKENNSYCTLSLSLQSEASRSGNIINHSENFTEEHLGNGWYNGWSAALSSQLRLERSYSKRMSSGESNNSSRTNDGPLYESVHDARRRPGKQVPTLSARANVKPVFVTSKRQHSSSSGHWDAFAPVKSFRTSTGAGVEIPEGIWPLPEHPLVMPYRIEGSYFVSPCGSPELIPLGGSCIPIGDAISIEPLNLLIPEPGATLIFPLVDVPNLTGKPIYRICKMEKDNTFVEQNLSVTCINGWIRIKTLMVGGVFALFEMSEWLDALSGIGVKHSQVGEPKTRKEARKNSSISFPENQLSQCRSETRRPATVNHLRDGTYVALDWSFDYDDVSRRVLKQRNINQQSHNAAMQQAMEKCCRLVVREIADAAIRKLVQLELEKKALDLRLAEEEFAARACDFVVIDIIRAQLAVQDLEAVKVVIRMTLGHDTKEASRFHSFSSYQENQLAACHFNECFTMRMGKSARRRTKLRVDAFLCNISKDSEMLPVGQTSIPLDSLNVGSAVKGWYDFQAPIMGRENHLQMVVGILQAKDLIPADRGGTSDPYVTVRLDEQTFQTKIIPKSLNPVWNEVFGMDLGPSPLAMLEDLNEIGVQLRMKAKEKVLGHDALWSNKIVHIEVWDHDWGIGGHDFLGQVSLPVVSLRPGKMHEDWFPLRGREGQSDKISGSIRLKVLIRIVNKRKCGSQYDAKDVETDISRGRIELSLLRIRELSDKRITEITVKGLRIKSLDKELKLPSMWSFHITVQLDGQRWKTKDLLLGNEYAESIAWDDQFHLDVIRSTSNLICRFNAMSDGNIKEYAQSEVAIASLSCGVAEEIEIPIRLLKKSQGGETDALLKFNLFPGIKSLDPEKISITVVQATGLLAADLSGTSDPFVCINLDGELVHRTKVIKRTLDPCWNEGFVTTKARPRVMEFHVFDHDLLGSNDFLGCCSLYIPSLDTNKEVDRWFDLQPRFTSDESISGRIRLKILREKEISE